MVYLIALSISLFVRPDTDSSLAIIMLNVSMILWALLTIQGISLSILRLMHLAIQNL